MKFHAAQVTDSKRLVRGEVWLAARRILRAQDQVHNRAWRLLLLAGGCPEEEIACVRDLMPRARVEVADLDDACLSAATRAGADMVHKADVLDAPTIDSLGDFDAVFLDTCSHVSDRMKRARGRWTHRTRFLALAFSYGRDVTEMFDRRAYGNVPAPLGGRVRYLFGDMGPSASHAPRQVQVLAYKGASTPMCVVLQKVGAYGLEHSFVAVDQDALSVAFQNDYDPAIVYATAPERIAAFNRRVSALKASRTREGKESERE